MNYCVQKSTKKMEAFRNWRLGGGPDSIGFRMMRRINRPFQDAMLSDAEDDDDGKHLFEWHRKWYA